jgi:hypothetical protein
LTAVDLQADLATDPAARKALNDQELILRQQLRDIYAGWNQDLYGINKARQESGSGTHIKDYYDLHVRCEQCLGDRERGIPADPENAEATCIMAIGEREVASDLVVVAWAGLHGGLALVGAAVGAVAVFPECPIAGLAVIGGSVYLGVKAISTDQVIIDKIGAAADAAKQEYCKCSIYKNYNW